MKRLSYLFLLATGLLLFHASCERDLPAPAQRPGETPEALAELKAQVDETILETIRSTGQPFDWNTAPDELLWQAMQVSGNPLAVGYEAGKKNEVLSLIYDLEGVRSGETDGVLAYAFDELNFVYVNLRQPATLSALRAAPGVRYTEMSGYPILLEEMAAYYENLPQPAPLPLQRNMVLDPANGDYFNQVQNYSGGTATTLRRHRVHEVYRNYGIYGEGIGVAVLDNGVLPEYQGFMEANGYGDRQALGYYNPLWFLPWTQPDGPAPQAPDVFFISQLIEGQWLHGWQQNQRVLVGAPNADQYSVRASPLVLILVPSQVLGVAYSFLAMAQDPDVRVLSMSMGSIFRIYQLEGAIDYLNSQGKILVSAAGTSFPFIRDLIGVVFPASYEPVVAATGIQNREETGGDFVLGQSAHGGPQVDITIEREGSSSEATSGFAGMLALIWSANPSLTREEVLDIAVRSTWFYQQNGQKHPVFGWGTPDVLWAVEEAL